jgi:lipopolysaccharide export system protein LptC
MTAALPAAADPALRAARRARELARWRQRSRVLAAIRFALPAVIAFISVVFAVWAFFGDAASHVGPAQNPASSESIHMTNARFLGRDEQGRAYVLTAAGAMRDDANPMRVELVAPAMTFDADGANPTHMSADTGIYREDTRILLLDGHVTLHDAIGDNFATNQAIVDTVKGAVAGRSAVVGQGPTGAIQADSYSVADRGQTLVFQGRVHSRLNSHNGQFTLEGPAGRKSGQ